MSKLRSLRKERIGAFLIIVLLAFFVFSAAAFAQSESGTVSGQLIDPSGAAVAGATVRLIDIERNTSTQIASNSGGLYSFNNVRPGRYRIEARKDGFKVANVTGITVNIQDRLQENVQLELGSAAESVTVSASNININNTDGTVSTLVDATTVANMPLNGRSFQDLILLTPGVVTNSPQGLGGGNIGSDGEFSVNGQRTEANYYTVDGVSANTGLSLGGATAAPVQQMSLGGAVSSSTALGTTQALVSVDDLQEFRVQSSTYSAEFGRTPGGQFAFETKSGTNQWHGDAYDYLRNSAVGQANDYFNNYTNCYAKSAITHQPSCTNALRQNDFGGAVGGPVYIPGLFDGKDKTFFFVNYEGLRLVQPQEAALSVVPDYCMRGLAAPGTAGVCENASGSPYVGPTGHDRTPVTDTALLNVIKAFPLPNFVPEYNTADGVGLFVGGWSVPSSINSISVRLDQVVNDKMTVFFRFSDTSSAVQAHEFPSVQENTPFLTKTYTAGANNTFSSRLSNELRFNYSTSSVAVELQPIAFGGNTPTNIAAQEGVGGPGITSIEAVLLQLGPGLNAEIGQQTNLANQQTQWNIVDTVSYSIGAHQFKFGVDYRRLTPVEVPANESTIMIFGGEPAVESGTVGRGILQSQATAYPAFSNFSAFVQDNWKATHRLTISFGLRWELNPAPGVTQGILPYTIQGTSLTGTNPYALSAPNTPQYGTTWFNFAPRFGAAYVVRNNPGWEMVIRGGSGVFFDTGQELDSLSFFGPGYTATAPFGGTFGSSLSFPNPTSTAPPIMSIFGYSPHLQLPYTLQWNASVEQSLGKSQAVTISYVGAYGARLLEQNEFSTAGTTNHNAGNFTLVQNGSTSDYNALQVQYQRRFSRGLTVLGSYTWSHCIDYGSVNAALPYQRGDCDFDVRNNFSASVSYDLPNVGGNGIVKAILDHWGIDDRFTARSAMPVFLSGNPTIDPATGQQVPTAYGIVLDNGQPLPTYLYGSACTQFYRTAGVFTNNTEVCPGGRAINPCAFFALPSSGPPPTRNEPNCPTPGVTAGYTLGGQAPRNDLRGFDAIQMDLAIRREFPIYQRLRLQFRAEAFNVFNHPNFGEVQTQGPEFGLSEASLARSLGIVQSQYQMGGPRSMQFALKLIF